jgi:hypothetical protein
MFEYGNVDSKVLVPFSGSHPKIMETWLKNDAEQNFSPNENYRLSKRDRKHRISMQLEKWFSWDLSKKHYLPAKP